MSTHNDRIIGEYEEENTDNNLNNSLNEQLVSENIEEYEEDISDDSILEKNVILEDFELEKEIETADESDKKNFSEIDSQKSYDNLEGDESKGDNDILANAIIAGYSLKEFINIESCRKKIQRDYRIFLTSYVDQNGVSVYNTKIHQLCASNGESLVINYMHLVESNVLLAKLLACVPKETLELFDSATMDVILEIFPEYGKIKNEIHVRIEELPGEELLKNLRYIHINTLIRVSGVVTRRSSVLPQLKLIKFDCLKCGAILGPVIQDLQKEVQASICIYCESHGPFSINSEKTVYRNYQKITLQESPGNITSGRLPRQKEAILTWDLIDTVIPGDEIDLTGLLINNFSYNLNTKSGFPVFATIIEANYIVKKSDKVQGIEITDDDIRKIKTLSKDPNLREKIINSIAPSIYGHKTIKRAIALALFGGQEKNIDGKVNIRGNINVLILGDPGTAKSQFLKYVDKLGMRSIYTTGQGASAVGLTAAVRKDHITKEWTLEGGALVLADKGICLIDEFDKMSDHDRVSIHEAMEQQSISISKAGIITTLHARCPIIAAANPVGGRYNNALNFFQNVNLTDPIISRFDILCIVRDIIDPIADKELAKFILKSHISSLNQSEESNSSDENHDKKGEISQELLLKLIMYAKKNVFPVLNLSNSERIANVYSKLRKESFIYGGLSITARSLESIIRISEASAKMSLRSNVNSDDVDFAIQVILESFISSQKFSLMNRLRKKFFNYFAPKSISDVLIYLIHDLFRDNIKYVHLKSKDPNNIDNSNAFKINIKLFEEKVSNLGLQIPNNFYQSDDFVSAGFKYLENHIFYSF